ncbi:MAG: DUF6573 family protein [Chloroflexota bacterium]
MHGNTQPNTHAAGASDLWDDADLIASYTRAEALADGVLIDVTREAREKGFRTPVAITAALHARLEPDENEASQGQSYTGRLHDVLWCASIAARRAAPGVSRLSFRVSIAETPPRGRHLPKRIVDLWAVIGPGDSAEPVITIGFPADF